MKIVSLQAENIKRLSAVLIKPDGPVVQITGKNGQGKSSVLDSIAYAIGGKDLVCQEPVRKGQAKAKITCELDDMIITRTFTATGGGTLTVANRQGAKFPSPQAILDKLVGKLAFDPLAFSRMAPKQQAETLRQLVGLDFSEIETRRKIAFDDRTVVNAQAKQLKGQLAGLVRHDDAPGAEVSVADLAEHLKAARESNGSYRQVEQTLARSMIAVKDVATEIADLEQRLVAARQRQKTCLEWQEKHTAMLTGLAKIDLAPIEQQLAGAEAINRKVRDNIKRAEVARQIEYTEAESAKLTAKIDALDAEKTGILEWAKFPVDGLAFDETGVLMNGVPFSQASSAEQLRVSVAMGLAMNPELRVLLIRDGSLLDDDSLQIVAEMAEKADAQIWIERVANGESVGVVIEDGAIAAVEAK